MVAPPVPQHLVQAQREIKAGRLTPTGYYQQELDKLKRSADDRRGHILSA
jgi:hypothetical protein